MHLAALAVLLGASQSAVRAQDSLHGNGLRPRRPVVLKEMGARPFEGKRIGRPDSSLACDHGYVEWFIPFNARKLPMLMVHASSTKTWQTTFDGRDGFQPIFLRRGWAVYMTDLPRTGRAGQGCAATTYEPAIGHDQSSFNSWRLGLWLPGDPTPNFYRGVQFPSHDRAALDEFLRIQYPEFNSPENEQIETDALAELLREIGPSIMLTHSSTGIRGWITATKSSNVAAIVSYEPGNAVFPEGELPPPIERADGTLVPVGETVPMADFLKLTKMPIQIVWGDFIPDRLDPVNVGPRLTLDNRRINRIKSELMAEAINRHGGDAQVLRLPDIGIHGNTHFMMLDLNNVKIANLLSRFLREKGLDGRRHGQSREALASR
jgi:hypothetical protein